MNTTFKYRLAPGMFIIFLIFLLSGCSTSSGILKFSSLRYPVSMSAFLYDKDSKIVVKGENLEPLGQFEIKKTFWSLAYGLIPLTQGESIDQQLNEKIKASGGDGVINLSVTVEHGVTNKIFSFLIYLPSYVPVFPGTARVTLTGEIVKLSQPATSFVPDEERNGIFTSKEEVKTVIKKLIDESI